VVCLNALRDVTKMLLKWLPLLHLCCVMMNMNSHHKFHIDACSYVRGTLLIIKCTFFLPLLFCFTSSTPLTSSTHVRIFRLSAFITHLLKPTFSLASFLHGSTTCVVTESFRYQYHIEDAESCLS